MNEYISKETPARLREMSSRSAPRTFLRAIWRKVFGYRGIISSPVRRMIQPLRFLLSDIGYSLKLLCGIASGFDGLQARRSSGWEYIGWRIAVEYGQDGKVCSFKSEFTELRDDPYYVCVVWKNRSHTPLPIVLGADGDYPLQNRVVRRLWRRGSGEFHEARLACAYYDWQWQESLSAIVSE